MKVIDRMKKAIYRRKGDIILTRDFGKIASQSAVAKALVVLVKEGVLYKLGNGVYAKAEEIESGLYAPKFFSLRGLSAEALERLGIPYELGEAERQYNAGSTQIPGRVSFEVYGRKITRTLSMAGMSVVFENRKKS